MQRNDLCRNRYISGFDYDENTPMEFGRSHENAIAIFEVFSFVGTAMYVDLLLSLFLCSARVIRTRDCDQGG